VHNFGRVVACAAGPNSLPACTERKHRAVFLGRLVRVGDQNGNVATYMYDAVGNLLSITRTTAPGNGGLAIFNVVRDQEVGGSNPPAPTTFRRDRLALSEEEVERGGPPFVVY
jgi:YD repeat-containing protein